MTHAMAEFAPGCFIDFNSIIDHAVSNDGGQTWNVLPPCNVPKGARNPQTALIDGVFILHARTAGEEGFVFYTSEDATNWDEGTVIAQTVPSRQYYSNNILLADDQRYFLPAQYSESYQGSKVNVKHLKLRIKK